MKLIATYSVPNADIIGKSTPILRKYVLELVSSDRPTRDNEDLRPWDYDVLEFQISTTGSFENHCDIRVWRP